MASAVAAQDSPPQGMFVVGAGVDVASVKSHLQDLVEIPVNAPEESGLALARGAALAAASAPIFDASTVGLAYSQDPDGATSGNDYPGQVGADTQIRSVELAAPLAADIDFVDAQAEEGRKPFLLVGSALTSVFVIGVIALVISLAVSIRPTADQRPDPGQAAIIPSALPPAAPAPAAVPPPAPEAAPPAPAPETIQAPVPVAKEQRQAPPPRTVYVDQQPAAQPPPPAAIPDPPAAPPLPDPVPVVAPPPVYIPPLLPRIFTPPQQQWPQQQYPQYPQQQYPQWPQQPPKQQWPQQPQWPQSGGDDGWPGRGGHGGGSGNDGWPGRGGHGGGSSNGALSRSLPLAPGVSPVASLAPGVHSSPSVGLPISVTLQLAHRGGLFRQYAMHCVRDGLPRRHPRRRNGRAWPRGHRRRHRSRQGRETRVGRHSVL
jgi:hypothetical protein